MRSIKKRLLSLLLTLITILSLLPTSALAASGTGKGITITKDQAYPADGQGQVQRGRDGGIS